MRKQVNLIYVTGYTISLIAIFLSIFIFCYFRWALNLMLESCSHVCCCCCCSHAFDADLTAEYVASVEQKSKSNRKVHTLEGRRNLQNYHKIRWSENFVKSKISACFNFNHVRRLPSWIFNSKSWRRASLTRQVISILCVFSALSLSSSAPCLIELNYAQQRHHVCVLFLMLAWKMSCVELEQIKFWSVNETISVWEILPHDDVGIFFNEFRRKCWYASSWYRTKVWHTNSFFLAKQAQDHPAKAFS